MPQSIQLSGQAIQGFATASAQITTSATTTATSSGTATTLMTAGPADFAGGVYDVILQSPGVTKGTTSVTLELWVDGVFSSSIVSSFVNATAISPFYWQGRVSLVSGIHTITVRGFVDAGTGTLTAGTGLTTAQPPATLIVRPA